ncbi:MAG: ATP-binding cassette domain-containing protein [Eubacteriales bacterium]|nr:ATP-binding cassette domain-containing protein [Eubacteriales bacterium]
MQDKHLNPDTILSVQHLRQYFPVGRGRAIKAVDDVSFDIKRGEVFGLVGESGCGKTTTGRSIIGLYETSGGHIYYNGKLIADGHKGKRLVIKQEELKTEEAISRLASVRDQLCREQPERSAEIKAKYDAQIAKEKEELARFKDEYLKKFGTKMQLENTPELMGKMQMIFQDPIASINPRMTVREIISEGLIIQGVKDKDYIHQRVNEVLERVGLVREHGDRYPHEFSGGQRQRIGIARAIIMEPDLIIADEPISALDVSIQAQVINLMNELRDNLGLTILFIAHNLSVVKYFSDRIAVMYFGKIVELADSEELFHHPLHPYTKSLLSAIPYPDPHYERRRQRRTYSPLLEHDYTFDKPEMIEITPGHFIYCNEAERVKYLEELQK